MIAPHTGHGLEYRDIACFSFTIVPFHEKAGECQAGLSFFSLQEVLLSSRAASGAILPSALFVERFIARCMLGVLVSVGAAT